MVQKIILTEESLKGQSFGLPLFPHFNRCAPFFKAIIAFGKIQQGKKKNVRNMIKIKNVDCQKIKNKKFHILSQKKRRKEKLILHDMRRVKLKYFYFKKM